MSNKLYFEEEMDVLFSGAFVTPPCSPEQLRSLKITCRCGKSTTAQVAEQVANRITVHFCDCGAMYGVKRDAMLGFVKDDQGNAWFIRRCPEMIQKTVMNALQEVTQGYVN